MRILEHKKKKKTVEKALKYAIIYSGAITHTTHIMDSTARALDAKNALMISCCCLEVMEAKRKVRIYHVSSYNEKIIGIWCSLWSSDSQMEP